MQGVERAWAPQADPDRVRPADELELVYDDRVQQLEDLFEEVHGELELLGLTEMPDDGFDGSGKDAAVAVRYLSLIHI